MANSTGPDAAASSFPGSLDSIKLFLDRMESTTLDARADYTYTPLRGPRSIRLLTVKPADQEEADDSLLSPEWGQRRQPIIEATLEEVDLDSGSCPSFEALSYVWDPWQRRLRGEVRVDGKMLTVSDECRDALLHLRRRRCSGAGVGAGAAALARVLWVDAICIDQKSAAEKACQVPLMGDVYARAERVLIWTGTGKPFDNLGLLFFRSFEQVLDADEKTQLAFARDRYQGWHDAKAFLAHIWNPFGRISVSRWFHRVWTLQELALARKAVLYQSRTTLMWPTYVFALGLLNTVEKERGMHGTMAEMHAAMGAHAELRSMMGNHDSDPSETGTRAPITSVLAKVFLKEATIPVDRIFSLYGILSRLGVSLPSPDYDRPVESVFTEVARLAIEHDNSLDILGLVNGLEKKDRWPSWVPTWHERQPSAPLKPGAWSAGGKTSKPRFSFSPDGTLLTIRVRKVDTIAKRSVHSPYLGQRSIGRGLMPMFQPYLEAEAVRAYSEWMSRSSHWSSAGPTSLHWDRYTDPSIGEVMLRTMLQEMTMFESESRPETRHEASEGYQLWQALLSAALNNKKDGSGPIVNIPGIPTMADVESMVSTGMRPSWVDDPHQEWDGRDREEVLRSDQWKVSRAIFSDQRTLNFHTNMHLCNKAKCLLATTGGYLGTATNSAVVGDHIVLVSGLEYPLVVRPTDKGGCYEVIGPAYIHGIMRGEKWAADDDDGSFEDITLS